MFLLIYRPLSLVVIDKYCVNLLENLFCTQLRFDVTYQSNFNERVIVDIMAAKGKITINQELCKACELCITVCPDEAIGISEGLNGKGYHPAEFVKDSCRGCGLCAVMCPEVIIEVYRG